MNTTETTPAILLPSHKLMQSSKHRKDMACPICQRWLSTAEEDHMKVSVFDYTNNGSSWLAHTECVKIFNKQQGG